MRRLERLRALMLLFTALAAPISLAADPPAPTPAAAPNSAQGKDAAAGSLYKSGPGSSPVKTFDEDWRDEARTRTIPVRVYYPYKADTGQEEGHSPTPPAMKHPLVVFSPGLGASRTDYSYFARHLASHGYVVVVVSHPGSDRAAAIEWVRAHAGERIGQRSTPDSEDERPGGWLMTSINDPTSLRERPRDISFVISQSLAHADLGPHIDPKRIAVAGHSFGAYTAMAIGGMTVDLPEPHGGLHQSFRDERVRAILPMSPEGPGTMGIKPGAWDAMGVPVLYLTGTRDYGAGQRSVEWRRASFEATRGVDAYLVTLSDAGHMTFGNPSRIGGLQKEPLIDALGVAFFDGYLGNDAKALEFLKVYSLGKHAESVAEFKPAKVAVEQK